MRCGTFPHLHANICLSGRKTEEEEKENQSIRGVGDIVTFPDGETKTRLYLYFVCFLGANELNQSFL